MKFSSTSNTKVQSCLYPLFQNQCPHFLMSALFWKLFSENYLNPQVRINKMVNKHTVDYHPSPSQISCKGTPFHISLDSGGGLSLQNLSWVFPKSVYSTIPFKKMNLFILSHASKENSPASFYHYPSGRRRLPIPPKQHFLNIYFLTSESRGGEDYEISWY